MRFEPDIIVVSPDQVGPTLVAEVESARLPAAAHDERLRRYVFGLNTSVGMSISGGHVRIYRNTFSRGDPSAVELVAAADVPALAPGTSDVSEHRRLVGRDYQARVQHWLESLRSHEARETLSLDLQRAIEEHVLPLLDEGEVRPGAHRWPRTA